MTESHKQKIAEANRKARLNRVWVTNGQESHQIPRDSLDAYIQNGYTFGKKKQGDVIVPWNKGLRASNDPRVAKMRRRPKDKS
jgi:hypothetical protein